MIFRSDIELHTTPNKAHILMWLILHLCRMQHLIIESPSRECLSEADVASIKDETVFARESGDYLCRASTLLELSRL